MVAVMEPLSTQASSSGPMAASTSAPVPHAPEQQGPGEGAGTAAAAAAALRVAGMGPALQAVRELVGWPLLYAAEGQQLGVRWPRGLLLHGPPGCGKTLLVQAVAAEFGAELHTLSAASVFGAYMGESERRLREAWEAAERSAARGRAAVIFLDEVDALCPRRDGQHQHEARVVAQLLTLMDGAASRPAQARGHVVVVGATNRPNALDPALRRPGRLDREVLVPIPGPGERADILRLHARGLPLAPGLDLEAVAAACHGYSGADMAALAREAAMHALSNAATAVLEGLGSSSCSGGSSTADAEGSTGDSGSLLSAGAVRPVSHADFEAAMKKVGPSIVRGAEAEAPPTRWEDVGGLDSVKARLRQAVEWPMLHREAFQRLGLQPPRGVLLHGPPGCSKTTLARAAATASKATLLPLSCAQLYSMYVGEGEELLRDTFKRARMAAPSIIFLDEVDAMAAKRVDGQSSSGGVEAGVRLLSTLLAEMDGMELATGVLVLAATNRVNALDSALVRPGRFDVVLYVPPPDTPSRLQILQVHTRAMPLGEDVDLQGLAEGTEGFTGAELAGLCREAAINALREDLEHASSVCMRHFQAARAAIQPALTKDVLKQYEQWQAQHS